MTVTNRTNPPHTIPAAFRLSQMRNEIERSGLMSDQPHKASFRNADKEQTENETADENGVAVLDRVNAIIDAAKPRPN